MTATDAVADEPQTDRAKSAFDGLVGGNSNAKCTLMAIKQQQQNIHTYIHM